MSTKTIGRIVGALFLFAFVVYLAGDALVGSAAGTPPVLTDVADNQVQISAGVLLMLVNSAVVVAIGVLVFPVLTYRHELSAYAYLVTRAFEAVTLAVGTLFVLLLVPLAQAYVDAGADGLVLPSLARVAQEGNHYAMLVAMIALGLGSLMFCRVLFKVRLVPRFMAAWGIVGYVLLATGGVLEVLGYGVFMALAVPGGLFEIALGVLLLVKGFPVQQDPLEPVTATAGQHREVLHVQ